MQVWKRAQGTVLGQVERVPRLREPMGQLGRLAHRQSTGGLQKKKPQHHMLRFDWTSCLPRRYIGLPCFHILLFPHTEAHVQ